MTLAAATLAVLLAATSEGVAPSPCNAPAETARAWEAAAAADEDLAARIQADAPGFHRALLERFDRSATPGERAKAAGERLAILCAGLASWRDPSIETLASPDRSRLEAILQREEFSGASRRQGNALEAFLRRFAEALERMFGTSGSERFASASRVLVLTLALAALVGGVARVLTLRRARRSARAGAEDAATKGLGSVDLAHPDVHRERARRALETDPRSAIREGLLALISALERRRWARPDRVKTNRELALELPGRGAPLELSADVTRVVDWYDRTFYSLEPVAAEEAQRFLDRVFALEARVPRESGSSRGAA